MSRLQLALNVSDLEQAIAFYSKLFATPPAKVKDGYANWEVSDPPLKLVVFEAAEGGTLNHLGAGRVRAFSAGSQPTGRINPQALERLAAQGWQDRFACVICGDSLPTRKPDPAMLQAAIAGVGGGPVLYVGDSEVDAETAHAAGVGFLLFTEGYRKSPVEALNPLASFSHFAELPALVARWMA